MNLLKCKVLITVITFLLSVSDGYKILGVFPTSYKSHWIIGASISKQLALAGHDVTFISPFELNLPNVRNAILTNYPKDPGMTMVDLANLTPLVNFHFLPEIFENVIDFTLSHPNTQALMNEKFDAVIIEAFHSEALLGFGAHFKCPVIAVTTFGTSMYTNIMTGMSDPASYVPNIFDKNTDKMNFMQRLDNTITWKLDEFYLYFKHFPIQRKLYEKYFPNVATSFDEQRKKVALLLNNNHFSSSPVKPVMPNTVDIGGIHIEPPKELPEDVKDYLDSATEGAILFSMGSIIKAVQWPVEKREALIRAFSKLKHKVLWKYENQTLPNKPDNVMISSWLPQRDILAHPNVKLFITHGGLLGTTEALTEGVPVLGIPMFGDQRMNMKIAVDKGYALSIDFNDLSEALLTNALNQILYDPNMSLKALEYSKLYTDRPLSPHKSLVYWVEYVIKHRGASHLRPASLDLNYVEFHLLDVYATFLVFFTLLILSCKILIVFIARKCKCIFTSTAKNKSE